MTGHSSRFEEHELTKSNNATIELMLEIITKNRKWEDFIANNSDIARYRAYTKLLESKRVIYIHAGGQSGGSIFANAYCRSISQGKQPKTLLVSIRCVDSLYKYCGFFFNSLKSAKARIDRKLGKLPVSEGLFFEGGQALLSKTKHNPKITQITTGLTFK